MLDVYSSPSVGVKDLDDTSRTPVIRKEPANIVHDEEESGFTPVIQQSPNLKRVFGTDD